MSHRRRSPSYWDRHRQQGVLVLLGPRPGRRFAALDGLRGLAAMLVVLFHMKWSNHLTGTLFMRNGYLAVDLFFLLSGFIIFANYAHDIADFDRLRRFITLRFFRIYPLHFALLALFAGLEGVKAAAQYMGHSSEQSAFTGGTSLAALGANVLLVHGLHTLSSLSWNLPSWSISCEFAVYILFGLLALGGMLSRQLCVFVITPVCIALYGALALSLGTLNASYDWGIVRAIGGFFLAPLLIVLGRGVPAPSRALGLAEIAAAAGAIAIMAVATGAMVVLVIPLLFLAVCLLQTDEGPVARILQSAAIQYLGRISYSIYMVQMVVLLAASITLKRVFKVDWSTIDPWIGDVMVLAIAGGVVAAASVTFRLIEEPGRALGRLIAARSIKAEAPRCGQKGAASTFRARNANTRGQDD